MKCFKCDNDKEAAFFEESFPCKCGEDMVFQYNLCPDCGQMWRSVNGEVTEDSLIQHEDLMGLVMPPKVTTNEEEARIVENMEEEIVKIEKIDRGEAGMSDYVHKCIRCNAVAHEKGQGMYGCSTCGFEWEVIKFD